MQLFSDICASRKIGVYSRVQPSSKLFSRLISVFVFVLLLVGNLQVGLAEQGTQSKEITVELQPRGFDEEIDPERLNIPVLLRTKASRMKKQKAQDYDQQWSAKAANGTAVFSGIPESALSKNGYAVVTFEGTAYYSKETQLRGGRHLEIPIYPVSSDPNLIEVKSMRTIVQPWEDYVVLTQTWELGTSKPEVLDTTLIKEDSSKEGKKYEAGLPIALPMESEGIQVSGDGNTNVVDNTIYWTGVLYPERVQRIQVRYSAKVSSETFVWEQQIQHPVESAEIYVPLRTDFEKVPRLNDAELTAPGFETVEARDSVPAFPGTTILVAEGKELTAGDYLLFRVTGLPFSRPKGPWIALLLGGIIAIVIITMGFREQNFWGEQSADEKARAHLEEIKSDLMTDLEALERGEASSVMTDAEFEERKLTLRRKLTLVLEQLEELKDSNDADG